MVRQKLPLKIDEMRELCQATMNPNPTLPSGVSQGHRVTAWSQQTAKCAELP